MASEFVEQALIASFFQGRNKTEVQEQLLDVDPEWLEGAATKPLLAAMRACLLGGEAIIEATRSEPEMLEVSKHSILSGNRLRWRVSCRSRSIFSASSFSSFS